MDIALIGHGNMGKEIETLVRESGKHTIVSISCTHADETLDKEGIAQADVAIDFTSPEVVMHNIREVAELGVPLVVGTTGWYDQMDDVKHLVEAKNTALVYGQNFSIGANIFFQIVAFSSQLFARFPGYDVFAQEIHHTGKKDSPSGTARKLADIILENFPAKKTLQSEKLDRQVRADELHFASVRGGRNRGRHEITFDGEADQVTLTHQAHGRRGFAQGALVAAEFIEDKKGVHSFDEIFSNNKAPV